MELLLLQGFNALSVGSVLLLIALGLAFTFGLMGVINMAHGEMIMAGAYVTYVLQLAFTKYLPGAKGAYFLVALPAAFLVAGLLGLLMERLLVRHLYGRPLDTLLATWGVSLMLQQAARTIFGAPNVQVVSPPWLNGGLKVLGAVLPYKRLFILALAVLCVVGISLYLTRTAGGRRIRAVMQSRPMAACMGIATSRVDALTFALGSGLAGVAGAALTLLGPVGPATGTYYIVDAFLVVILGGVGQLLGTVVAALGIGAFNVAFELGSSASIGKVLVLLAIIVFLQWKPSGLFALRTRALD
ncbi:urea ABC transporter permease subunit UrtB [Hydrogenibacillus schlegelii]|uniref:Urea ABC transporter permease subunit UrtB n=1 Tax=Hydrogenibacillus schlegelii TaxID=1484 RepID=A0A132N478_HYDSH|nr:urea ABC transporter permease subunit UrtB [Hydrogenibacillus schlegelii]KWX04893.1 ABC transporter permease [Hydrogenibacillus schlegelii]OAR04397.1 urea ABC transporter permease subunit UrtB [Hydrogenibacillus schlegelii]